MDHCTIIMSAKSSSVLMSVKVRKKIVVVVVLDEDMKDEGRTRINKGR